MGDPAPWGFMSNKNDKKGNLYSYIATSQLCDPADERQIWKFVKGQIVSWLYPKICLVYTPKKNEKHSLEGVYTW